MRGAFGHRAAIASIVVLSGCASYQPSPLPRAHPAHPEAPAAREAPVSQTLAYTPADAVAIRGAAALKSAHGGDRAPGAAATTVVGEGEVIATTPASGQIIVDHPEIKGFMEAMTMGYRIEPPSLLTTIKPGDRIRFTIDVNRRAIVQIEKLP